MCGIVASWSPRGVVSPIALERATASLEHRGPDGRGHWFSEDQHVGLGHTRLSIIDLETGQQPIASEDERIHVVVNGEFYGYEAIQRELVRSGHRLRTRSDSEILVHLYEDLGPQCVHRLRGEYAFVVWDAANRVLFAGRDRCGIKPLFYALVGDAVLLASEVKALFAAGVPARWNPLGLYRGVGVGIDQTETLYDGIRQIPPGYYLIADGSHVQLHRYWDFDYPTVADMGEERPDAEYIAEFREVLRQAVRIRLRADVPVGCYLSGGLDSCSILGLAATAAATPIRAFTLTFDDAAYDEATFAREMAERAHAEFYPIPIHQSDLADYFFDATWHAETFCLNAHGVAKFVLSRAVRDAGYKVVLTGEGSDEVLGGYPHFRRDMLLHDSGGQDPSVIRGMLEELESSNPVSRGLLMPVPGIAPPVEGVRRLLGFVPTNAEVALGRLAALEALFADDFRARFAGCDYARMMLESIDVRGQLTGRSPMHIALYLWAKTALPRYILTVLGDRMEMAHSIEGRVPFLDHEVIGVLTRMPVRLKLRGMTEKFVLREAARPELTDTVYRRQKHPFLSPPASLNPREKLYALLNDTLRGPTLRCLPFFDQRRVVALLDRLPTMSAAERVVVDQHLMLLLSSCALHERLHLAS